jgi:hypothetical protein
MVPLLAPCLLIPADTWTSRVTLWAESRTVADHSFEPLRLDLDADGVLDVLVPVPAPARPKEACPEDTVWDLYLVRGSCGHLAGRIEGAPQGPPTGALLSTVIAPSDGHEGAVTVLYRFDGQHYQEVQRLSETPRCEIHPEDCWEAPHRSCALRDHPLIAGPFDPDDAGELLYAAAQEAQRVCRAPARRIERCDVRPTFAPDGTVTEVQIEGCPRRQRCVEPLFLSLRARPYSGEAAMPSISFQIPTE